jgi:hypothetical protein
MFSRTDFKYGIAVKCPAFNCAVWAEKITRDSEIHFERFKHDTIYGLSDSRLQLSKF